MTTLHPSSLRRALAVLALGAAAVGCAGPAFAQAAQGRAANAAKPESYRTIDWTELTPKDWNPLKGFSEADLATMQDNDPRAEELLRQMRESWNNAPTNKKLDGQAVRLPGFVVPLDASKAGMREFLLVPYFGACIHVPPPPANQVAHVKLQQPDPKIQMMDAVWVSGRLRLAHSQTDMGASGYTLEAVAIEPYTGAAR